MNMHSIRNSSKTFQLILHQLFYKFRKQAHRAHLTALGTALTQSSVYFLQCACFGYGSKLVENGEITYSQMYR